jgi:outer membrane protein assembly factor BamB
MSEDPPSRPWHLTLKGLRWVTLALPPLALVLLWLSSKVSRREKVLGSIGIPLFFLLYWSGIVWGLHVCFGIDWYEWRGGYTPVFTFSPTLPDYEAVEASRRRQRAALASVEPSPRTSSTPYWTRFRGPKGDGVYDEIELNTDWLKSPPRLLWKQPIGGGYGSFAVAHGCAFTLEQRREREVVTAYDVETGHEMWAHGWEAEFRESIGGNGPRTTPTWHDGKLYALGGNGEFRCLKADDGSLVWRRDIIKENAAPMLEYGCSGSPLVVDDLVVVLPGGGAGKSVVAYDRLTGEPRWSALDDRQAYVSPTLIELAGERQLIVVAAKRTVGLALTDGRVLWEFTWGEPLMGRNVAQPVAWQGTRIMLSAGYDVGSVVFELKQSPSGWQATELWRNKFLKNKFTSSIFWQGHIYGLDEEMLTCLDAATGERKWKDGRYGYGQPVLAGGHLIILCGNGDLALVQALPDRHVEIARIPGIKGKTWNHPAIAGGKLLVRNAIEMACFDLSVK